jgi:hypothetical protein
MLNSNKISILRHEIELLDKAKDMFTEVVETEDVPDTIPYNRLYNLVYKQLNQAEKNTIKEK